MTFIPPRHVGGDSKTPTEAEVVIVGGGIVGTATALALAERGVKVALCEKGNIGAEQSCRNWGWTRQMGRNKAEAPLIIRSIHLWSELKDRVQEDVGFRRTGIAYLCRTQKQLAEYEAWLPLAREYNIDTRLVGANDMAASFPGISKGFVGALYTATDGYAEPHLAAPAMADAARRKGAYILTQCAVRGLSTCGGALCGVVTEHGEIACRQVLLAAGRWSRLFAGNLGIDIPMLDVIGTAARVEIRDAQLPAMPVGGDNFAFRPRADGGYTIARRNATVAPITWDSFRLFNSFAPTLINSWKEFRLHIGNEFVNSIVTPRHWSLEKKSPFEDCRILDPRPLRRRNREALRNLAEAFPAFANATITHEWAGAIDATPDATPIIGPVTQLPGLFLATGFSGHGFGLGPAVGELAADLLGGTPPRIDASPFDFKRFERGNP